MPVRHYLGPWVWDAAAGPVPHWRGPAGTVGVVDLATPGQCGSAGNPAARGVAYFAVNTPSALGSEYTLLGQGVDPRDIAATALVRSAWQSAAGHAPQGDTVAALLADHLTAGADPDGEAACNPLVPEGAGRLRLVLAGVRLANAAFAWGDAYTN